MTKSTEQLNKQTTLSVNLVELPTWQTKLSQTLRQLIPSLLFFLGLYYLLFPLDIVVNRLILLPVISGLIALLLFHFLSLLSFKVKYLKLIVSVILIVFVLLFYKQLKHGFLQVLNKLITMSGIIKGSYFFKYEVTASSVNLLVFLCLAAILLAWWSTLLSNSRNKSLLVVTWIIVIGFVSTTKLNLSLLALVSLFSATLFISIGNSRETRTTHTDGQSEWYYVLSLSLLMSLLLGISYLTLASSSITELSPITNFKKQSSQLINHWRYETKKRPSLPRGNLQNYQEKRGKQTELQVTMSQPESIYLKSFVGTQFLANQWTNASQKALYDSGPLLYWLEKAEFSSFSQLSQLSQLGEETSQETNQVTVSNQRGNSRQLLVPYGVELADEQKAERKDDTGIYLSGLKGQRKYSFNVQPQVLVDYPARVNDYAKISELATNQKQKTYLENEKNYNQFVYEHYLTDISELKKWTTVFLEDNQTNNDRAFYEEADQRVYDYFDKYQEKMPVDQQKTPIETEFIALHFKGLRDLSYDVEYATIGTLLYRSMGIPARYVEGYLVKPNKAATVNVTGKEAHAWVEIYQDGVGWVPKEPMPDYRDVMPTPEFTGLTHQGESEKQEGDENRKEDRTDDLGKDHISEEEQAKEKLTKQLQEKRKRYLFYGLLSALIIGSIVGLISFIRFIYQRVTHLKKEQLLRNSDDNLTASLANFREITTLLLLDKIAIKGGSLYDYTDLLTQTYSKKYSRLYQRVVQGIQSGVYSEQNMRTKTKEQSDKLLNQTRVLVIENKPLKERLKYKFRRFKRD